MNKFDERDSIDLDTERMSYPDCDCVRFSDWDIHRVCHFHLGPAQARDLFSNPGDPPCYYCRSMGVDERFRWLVEFSRVTGTNPSDLGTRQQVSKAGLLNVAGARVALTTNM